MPKEYIDREAAVKAVYQYLLEQTVSKYATSELCIEARGAISRAMDVLYDVPAADVTHVVHGEWVVTKTERGWNCSEYPIEFTCSVCGRTEPEKEPYCHCSAKMDGGANGTA